MTTLHAANSTRWLSFFNASGETIPSYGVFSIPLDTEAPTTENERLKLTAKKYDPQDSGDDPDAYMAFGGRYERVLALNSKSPVQAGRWGQCTFAFDGPAWARWQPQQDSAIPEDRFDNFLINSNTAYPVQIGPYPGTFGMSATGFGFRVIRVPGSSDDRVLVQQIPPEVPFQVRVTSPWLSAFNGGVWSSNSGSPYTWLIGQPLNGLENFVTTSTPTAGTPRHLACIAIRCGRINPNTASAAGVGVDVGAIVDPSALTVRFHRGEFFAISGGSHFIANCKVVSGSTDGDAALVDISFSLDDPVGDASSYYVECYPSDPSFTIPTGVFCDVQYSVTDHKFYATAVHCPG